MRKALVVSLVTALLMTIVAVALPAPSAAQVLPTGGYVDQIIFSVVPQAQAVDQVAAGDIDQYIFRLDIRADVIRAKDNPNIHVNQAFAGHRALIVNPVPRSDGKFNPFTIREIREALHWALDRNFMLNEYGGGQGIVKITSQFAAEPNYVREAAFFAQLEARYGFDMERARTEIGNAMAKVPGASFNSATGKWLVNGQGIDLTIISRLSPDPRFLIGEHMKGVLNGFGFNAVTQPSTFEVAIDTVYGSQASLGLWSMYTEGWGSSGFTQFDDTNGAFYYTDNGDSMFNEYEVPADIVAACVGLEQGEYATLAERSQLLRTCEELGMRDAIRQYLWADRDTHIYNNEVSGTVYDIFSGNQNPFATRTTRVVPGSSRLPGDPAVRADGTGGTLRVGQPIHTQGPWNGYGGFQDVYSTYQQWAFHDYGTFTNPHLGVVMPIRADFKIVSVSPAAAPMDVNATALAFNTTTMVFEPVGSGLTSSAYVDYDYNFGEWHHGEMMSMDDVLSFIATASRIAEGDVGAVNPATSEITTFFRFARSFRGFQILDADSIRIWYDTFNPDTSLIANRADVWPWYPWELDTLIAESAADNDTAPGLALSSDDGEFTGRGQLDLSKGLETTTDLQARLNTHATALTIPSYLAGYVNATETAARWAALQAWRTRKGAQCMDGPNEWTCGFTVGNGPYVLDNYISAPTEGAVYTAKRDGYPFEVNKWDGMSQVRIPTVVPGTAPQVVQTFPATWPFTTSLAGQAYDRLEIATWLVFDPASRALLFQGDLVRTGAGQWQVRMTAEQTAGLAQGTYELRTVVVGEEAALPVITTAPFSTLSLQTAILTEIERRLNERLGPTEDDLEAATQAANDARAAANAANSLAQLLLIVTSVALVVAVVSVAMLAVVWRRLPKPTQAPPQTEL